VILIQEGDEGGALYIVLSGQIKVFVQGDDGREFVLGLFEAGDYVGEMSLDGGPRSASVMTTQATRCSVVSRAVLTDYLKDYPEFAFDLLSRVIRRARLATESVRGLALMNVYSRIAQLLQSQPKASGSLGGHGIQRLSHQEIANRVGCSREMVSRVMKDLVTGGYLSVDQDVITLSKPLPAAW
jgi:CRP/FNR family cyclic AMP-dependent transcriptional regulator